jgi:hypothetical protein
MTSYDRLYLEAQREAIAAGALRPRSWAGETYEALGGHYASTLEARHRLLAATEEIYRRKLRQSGLSD